MTITLDTIPNGVKIRAAAGATLNLQVTLKLSDGTLFDTTGGAASSEIVDRNANGAPPVTGFATSLLTGSVVSLSLTSSQTMSLRGDWLYRVWIDLPGPTRMLLCHGELEVRSV